MLRVFLNALAIVALLCSACSDNSTGTGDMEPPGGVWIWEVDAYACDGGRNPLIETLAGIKRMAECSIE